ncbi:MAG: hypothetical protein N2645_04810 [Clostridia bacterium]|nr:hypothetical protein [Clostridia bacterium]
MKGTKKGKLAAVLALVFVMSTFAGLVYAADMPDSSTQNSTYKLTGHSFIRWDDYAANKIFFSFNSVTTRAGGTSIDYYNVNKIVADAILYKNGRMIFGQNSWNQTDHYAGDYWRSYSVTASSGDRFQLYTKHDAFSSYGNLSTFTSTTLYK